MIAAPSRGPLGVPATQLREDRDVDAAALRKLIDTAYLDMKRRLAAE